MKKIALEEHFHVPEMPEYSSSPQSAPDKALAKELDDHLAVSTLSDHQ